MEGFILKKVKKTVTKTVAIAGKLQRSGVWVEAGTSRALVNITSKLQPESRFRSRQVEVDGTSPLWKTCMQAGALSTS